MKALCARWFALLLLLVAPYAESVTCVGNIPPNNPDDAYTVNTDGTVTDRRTGLTWDRCAWGQTGSDCSGGSPSSHTWDGALQVAATANQQRHKGHADWRLPNFKELLSLVERCRYHPTINDTQFPNEHGQIFWSSSPEDHDSGGAWLLNMYYGSVFNDGRFNARAVRVVRGGQSFESSALFA